MNIHKGKVKTKQKQLRSITSSTYRINYDNIFKKMKTAKRKTRDGETVKVEVLNVKKQRAMTREALKLRARPQSQGGTRPDDMSREEWRTSQGSFYDDDRC